MAPVSVRRVVLLAPAAVRMRRSLAASLRMRLTVRARTARARMMLVAVAEARMVERSGFPFAVSMCASAPSASWRAAVFWAGVSGRAVWMSQPFGTRCSWSAWTACSVMRVLGAEVPEGRLPKVWIFGRRMQRAGVQW